MQNIRIYKLKNKLRLKAIFAIVKSDLLGQGRVLRAAVVRAWSHGSPEKVAAYRSLWLRTLPSPAQVSSLWKELSGAGSLCVQQQPPFWIVRGWGGWLSFPVCGCQTARPPSSPPPSCPGSAGGCARHMVLCFNSLCSDREFALRDKLISLSCFFFFHLHFFSAWPFVF